MVHFGFKSGYCCCCCCCFSPPRGQKSITAQTSVYLLPFLQRFFFSLPLRMIYHQTIIFNVRRVFKLSSFRVVCKARITNLLIFLYLQYYGFEHVTCMLTIKCILDFIFFLVFKVFVPFLVPSEKYVKWLGEKDRRKTKQVTADHEVRS